MTTHGACWQVVVSRPAARTHHKRANSCRRNTAATPSSYGPPPLLSLSLTHARFLCVCVCVCVCVIIFMSCVCVCVRVFACVCVRQTHAHTPTRLCVNDQDGKRADERKGRKSGEGRQSRTSNSLEPYIKREQEAR
jgi:hypothetical protein